MARARLKAAAPPKSANARRHFRVFSLRLTSKQRARLEGAARAQFPHAARPLARYVRWALERAAAQLLGPLD